VIEERTFGDHPERIPALAAELVAAKPDALLTGTDEVVLAFMRASATVPIVFAGATDPIGAGMIASYAHPGGKVTGTTRTPGSSLHPKLLDLLRQLIPGLERVAVVFEAWRAIGEREWHATQAAAALFGLEAQGVGIPAADHLETALEIALGSRPQALISIVANSTIIPTSSEPASSVLLRFAQQHGLPTAATYNNAGGSLLLYYGPSLLPLFRRAGNYHVDRILRGANPADLPFEGPTVFELIVNRATAGTLGMTIPFEVAAQVTEWVS
jgi:putative ABC transport system substrate-binding protein